LKASLILVEDITQNKASEQNMKMMIERLQIVNKEKELFTHICFHDLKEPLRAVSNFTRLLKEKQYSALDKTSQSYIDFVISGTAHMNKLIDGMLLYTTLDRKNKLEDKGSLEKALKEVKTIFTEQIARKSATIDATNLPTVGVNQTLLVQVLQNLIGNALKYCKANKPRVFISAKLKGKYWEILVKDNGIGIDKKHKSKIFNLFERGDSNGDTSGLGIGLSICAKIVKQVGGEIWVNSRVGKGSTFFFIVPKILN